MNEHRRFLGTLILWLILLVLTIVLLAIGEKPEQLGSEFAGLAVPIILYLTRKRK